MAVKMRYRNGAWYLGNGRCLFQVWGPTLHSCELEVFCEPVSHADQLKWENFENLAFKTSCYPMKKDAHGYWTCVLPDSYPGSLYYYRIESRIRRPDPASMFQPYGVFGPSQVVDHTQFSWEDPIVKPPSLDHFIFYEIHTGTFSEKGDFRGIIDNLKYCQDLGINALELMPVSQFPGPRNWGYDGAYLYAVQNSYGGPDKLKALVNACHKQGLAVILDVVYNHFGPEGNFISDFGPFYTGKHKTPWGKAVNFDGKMSQEVRAFLIENALYWFTHFHIDGLRLDATQWIIDSSSTHFLLELSTKTKALSRKLGKPLYLFAESDQNDTTLIKSKRSHGYGLDSHWCDDFHHALHSYLTKEQSGYYQDYGHLKDIYTALKQGFIYTGQYSKFRKKHYGSDPKHLPSHKFIVSAQNHDQTGNRLFGERLASLIPFEALKLTAFCYLLSPYLPLIFMGEEFGCKNPFLYFISHSNPDLIQAVREGRKREFAEFNWQGEPPAPESLETFNSTKINSKYWDQVRNHNNDRNDVDSARQTILFSFYKTLISLRKQFPPLTLSHKKGFSVKQKPSEKIIYWTRTYQNFRLLGIMNFNSAISNFYYGFKVKGIKLLDSSLASWGGQGSDMPDTLVPGQTYMLGSYCAVLIKLNDE
ncbi:malto-oligosyltrehalose trehalohydrolase [Thermoproteota archaeon]